MSCKKGSFKNQKELYEKKVQQLSESNEANKKLPWEIEAYKAG